MRAFFLALSALVPAIVFAQPADDDDLDVPAAPSPPPPVVAEPPPAPVPIAIPAPVEPVRAPSTEVVAVAPPSSGPLAALLDGSGIELRGFVQAQGQLDQQSQDQLMQGGANLNQDTFVVRRARLGVARTWTHAGFAFELDANTVAGATISLRRAEASVHWPSATAGAPPLIALTGGLTDIPFGRELAESSQHRLFMERTTSSRALFPGEADIGVRAHGAYRQFRYAAAVLAGEPINDQTGANRSDPNAAKDFLGRVGAEVTPSAGLVIAGGVSVIVGQGFHAGRDATKDALEWRDFNENGAVEIGELFSVPGAAAIPSENFRRWALGADLSVAARSRLGWTRVIAEVTVASNLDRGLFVGDRGHHLKDGVELLHGGLLAHAV